MILQTRAATPSFCRSAAEAGIVARLRAKLGELLLVAIGVAGFI